MPASSRFATVSEDDFALKCFFFLFFEMITCVFILKQLFASGSVIIGEYSPRLRLGEYSPMITSPSTNNYWVAYGQTQSRSSFSLFVLFFLVFYWVAYGQTQSRSSFSLFVTGLPIGKPSQDLCLISCFFYFFFPCREKSCLSVPC